MVVFPASMCAITPTLRIRPFSLHRQTGRQVDIKVLKQTLCIVHRKALCKLSHHSETLSLSLRLVARSDIHVHLTLVLNADRGCLVQQLTSARSLLTATTVAIFLADTWVTWPKLIFRVPQAPASGAGEYFVQEKNLTRNFVCAKKSLETCVSNILGSQGYVYWCFYERLKYSVLIVMVVMVIISAVKNMRTFSVLLKGFQSENSCVSIPIHLSYCGLLQLPNCCYSYNSVNGCLSNSCGCWG